MNNDDRVGELLKLAGRREMPDAERMSRAKAAAHAEWLHVAAHRWGPLRWHRASALSWAFSGALVAILVLAAAAWFRHVEAPPRATAPAARFATLQTVVGSVIVTRDGLAPRTVNQPGFELVSGDRLDTPAGSLAAFALAGGASVKVDRGSSVMLGAEAALILDRGAVFVDAGATPRASALSVDVRTPIGVVRHLGTQFEVRLHDEALRVRVREGSVAVENADGRWISREGEALRVTRGRPPERQSILTYGDEWSWVNHLAPPFVLEGSTLSAFLEWASHHHGLRSQYADRELRDRTARIVLHGSIDGLSSEEALDAVLRTCGLTSRRTGNLLVITRR